MSLIDFEFDAETHIYHVSERYVMATSDVLAFNGLSDYGAIPKAVLEHAGWRGTELHKAIELYEKDVLDRDSVPQEVLPYLDGYFRFKDDYDFQPTDMEFQCVYEHDESLIGCTIDLRGSMKGRRWVLDAKTSAKNYGKAERQTHLRWRLQLQSYAEATQFDEAFWRGASPEPLGKGVIHVNKDGGYKFWDFSQDESRLWDGAVSIAEAKRAAGFEIDRR